ncbi:MAG TPA: glycosyltransferase [Fimbriiglobus sp.]|jgi:glycosyltransferase involved in cell wall biosynthesis|nr:glycosyltransferase [Fimbriiglobus sp.]
MRILFLSSIYPKSYAPTRGVYCRSLCNALADTHPVHVISPTSWHERLGCRDVRAPAGASAGVTEEHPTYYYPPKVLRSRYDRFMWASVRGTVRRTLDSFSPDCILSYWSHPDGAVAGRAARLAGVPCGIIVGGSDVLLLTRDASRRHAVTESLQKADAVFAVGRDLQSKIAALGVDPAKIHVHSRGIDRTRFYPADRGEARRRLGLPEARNLLLFVGSLVPVKGLEVLTEAVSLLVQRGTDFQLLLAGDGPLRGSLEAEVARRGLVGHVQFVGRVAHEDLPDWYRAADLTVLSSHSEGVPNVLRESLACGTPYVSTRVGGVAELTDDPAVRLVPPADSPALASAIHAALEDRRLLDPARMRFKDWNQAADEVAEVFTRLIRNRDGTALEAVPS